MVVKKGNNELNMKMSTNGRGHVNESLIKRTIFVNQKIVEYSE